MAKRLHEFRDPLYGFIRLDTEERKVLDSRPLQRLRHIHQLALSYLVYPSATHRRFEHSLGVCELATRVYNNLTDEENIRHDPVREVVPRKDQKAYWRRVLRMAALCHDVGHLPFSHAAEDVLLPDGWDHERLTAEIIRSDEMKEIWADVRPTLDTEDIVKLAVGPKKLTDTTFSTLEALLSEIIVGDSFGADRMDYLLRDAYHAGVPYGQLSHRRLVDTLRLLPARHQESDEPTIGVEEGGLESVEALLLARYFMFKQVYFHPVRRIYDIHLAEFLSDWLPNGKFPTDLNDHLSRTDNEVIASMREAAQSDTAPGHEPASKVLGRGHYRLAYRRSDAHVAKRPDAGEAVFEAVRDKLGAANVKHDFYRGKGSPESFPVLLKGGDFAASVEASRLIKGLPVAAFDYVFVRPELQRECEQWLGPKLNDILSEVVQEEEE